MRLVIQSRATGCFLAPDLDDGQPIWVPLLQDAGGGVVRDEEAAVQLLEDHCDPADLACVVDLDRLGTADDYDGAAEPTASCRMRSVRQGEGGAVASATPLGNHGGNDL